MSDPDKPLSVAERLAAVNSLEKSVGWERLLKPELARRLALHRGACCSRDLTPEKRAEHIEAAACLEELLRWPEAVKRKAENELSARKTRAG